MNVAYVADVVYPYTKGGGEKRIYEIGRRLVAQGHEVTVYTRHHWDGSETMTVEGMEIKGVSPGGDVYTESGRRSISAAIRFATDLVGPLRSNTDEHDIIVAMAAPYFHVLSAKLGAFLSGTPLITTWHEVWLDHWDDYLDRFAYAGKLVERLVANIPHFPLAVSEMTADRLTRARYLGSDAAVIPNGIDISELENAGVPETTYDVLYVGRLIEDKNVDMVLKAFNSATVNNEYTLGIIGDGPQREALVRLSDELSQSDQIHFTGFLDSYEDVLGHMKAADVFVSPSIREGFGITLLEAMAARCTVVTVDHPHSAASFVVDDAGFVVEPSIQDITSALSDALSGLEPELSPYERALTFDWDKIAEEEADYYRMLVASGVTDKHIASLS